MEGKEGSGRYRNKSVIVQKDLCRIAEGTQGISGL